MTLPVLAVEGGSPVRSGRPWAKWPSFDTETEEHLLAALHSGRWSVSWNSVGAKSFERRFSEAFAEYNGAGYCVSVDHGSSALLVALETLDIGPGDEVIVPVLTWVAPVTAVLRVGALPVLVDVHPESGCVTAENIARAVTPATKAVIVVHLGCTVADLDDICAVAKSSGIAVIEDCSQAHGASWAGRNVGVVGDLGVFSLGAAKTLAGGEGGAVVTNDADRYARLQMLRADSRRYSSRAVADGDPELVEDGAVMGANYCMSEFAAAVLLDQLHRLDAQNRHRQQRAHELEVLVTADGLFSAIPVPERVATRAIYEFGVQVDPEVLGERPIGDLANAVSAELGVSVYPPRIPLHRSVLLRPQTKSRYRSQWERVLKGGRLADSYPAADEYQRRTLLLHHSLLLGRYSDVVDIATAFKKVGAAFLAARG